MSDKCEGACQRAVYRDEALRSGSSVADCTEWLRKEQVAYVAEVLSSEMKQGNVSLGRFELQLKLAFCAGAQAMADWRVKASSADLVERVKVRFGTSAGPAVSTEGVE